jgi:uncharacterized protein
MFEWDEQKNATNIEKHGIDFDDVIPVFFSRQALIVRDNRKDYGEDRFIVLCSMGGRVLHVAYTLRGASVRIISARHANQRERRDYEQRRT